MTTTRAATLQETLRLTKVPPNGLEWHKELIKGLPYKSLPALAKTLKVAEKELAALLGLSARTMAARKKARRLNLAESDLIYAIARAYVRLASYKSIEEARSWLLSKLETLKGNIPVDLLQTRLGTDYVMSTIDRERAVIVKSLLDRPLEEEPDTTDSEE